MAPLREQPWRAAFVLLILLALLAVATTVRLATLPEQEFTSNTIVDDAMYYVVPARNLLAGRGYTFDGEHRSNGVQPAWAVIVVGLVALVPDPVSQLRVMTLLSGLLWIGSALVLFAGLRHVHRGMALCAAAGVLLTANWNRMAAQGMENGLHGLLFAWLIYLGITRLRQRPSSENAQGQRGFLLLLGLAATLFALARVDSSLLAIMLGLAIGFGLLRPGERPRLGLNIRGALLFALPAILLAGSWLVFNQLYFGSAAPISGRVKMFYESEWPPLYKGISGTLIWHARFLFSGTSYAFLAHLDQTCWKWFHLALPVQQTQQVWMGVLGIGALAVLVYVLRHARRWRPISAWHVYAGVLVVFAVARFAVIAIKLQHFTGYTTWYFAPDCIALWMTYAIALLGLFYLVFAPRAWWSRLAGLQPRVPQRIFEVLVLVMLVTGIYPAFRPPVDDIRTNKFILGGKWMNERLPAGRRIGAYSAGWMGFFAPRHQVFNLDGLINDLGFFENYLKTGRIRDYIYDQRIEYFADYATLKSWSKASFPVMPENRQLVRWWRMGDDDNPLAYAIWRILPKGQTCDALGPCEQFCDRISLIQYAAEALGRFPVVDEDKFDAAVTTRPADAPRVVTSIVTDPERPLRHVLVKKSELGQLGLRPGLLDIASQSDAVFGDRIRLLGWDIPDRAVRHGRHLLVTRYWQVLDDHPFRDVSFEMWMNPCKPENLESVPAKKRLSHATRGCHGTAPIQEWHKGEIIAETYRILVGRDVPPGSYPIMLGLYEPQLGWLAISNDASYDSRFVCLGNVTVQ